MSVGPSGSLDCVCNNKALIRLHRCSGWSEHLLFAHTICIFSRVAALCFMCQSVFCFILYTFWTALILTDDNLVQLTLKNLLKWIYTPSNLWWLLNSTPVLSGRYTNRIWAWDHPVFYRKYLGIVDMAIRWLRFYSSIPMIFHIGKIYVWTISWKQAVSYAWRSSEAAALRAFKHGVRSEALSHPSSSHW